MKAVFIPFRRNQVFQMLAVLFLIILLIALGSGETLTVFSRAVNQPIYKGNEENPIFGLLFLLEESGQGITPSS